MTLDQQLALHALLERLVVAQERQAAAAERQAAALLQIDRALRQRGRRRDRADEIHGDEVRG